MYVGILALRMEPIKHVQDRVQHLLLWVVELLDPTEGAFCVNNGAGHEGTALYSFKRMSYLISRNGIMKPLRRFESENQTQPPVTNC